MDAKSHFAAFVLQVYDYKNDNVQLHSQVWLQESVFQAGNWKFHVWKFRAAKGRNSTQHIQLWALVKSPVRFSWAVTEVVSHVGCKASAYLDSWNSLGFRQGNSRRVALPSGKNQLTWLIISSIIDTTWTEVVAAISVRLLDKQQNCNISNYFTRHINKDN